MSSQGNATITDKAASPLTDAELQAIREIGAKLPIVDHPRAYPESAYELFDALVTLKYNDHNRWRVQVELADGTRATIGVSNNPDGELARVQIRGMALELLGYYLKNCGQGAGNLSGQ